MQSNNDVLSKADWDLNGGESLQLVKIVNNRFEIDEKAAEFLRSRRRGIGICSIAGKFRTGKSYLLNKLMGLKEGSGFTVSPSMGACTRGLWLWTRPLEIPSQNLEIFFMDTEGLDAPGKDSTLDSKLFALAVMISSCFMYNSSGNIDEPSIEALSLITNVIQEVDSAARGEASSNSDKQPVEPSHFEALYELS